MLIQRLHLPYGLNKPDVQTTGLSPIKVYPAVL